LRFELIQVVALQNLEPLRKRLLQQPAHLQTILKGCVSSLCQASNPLRFSNAALGLRELLRELFASLSPDESVKECSWFKPDKSSKTGVTRRHRILFAVYSYLNPEHFPKNFVSDVEKLAKQILDQIDELSKFTHNTKETLQTSEEAAIATVDRALGFFASLLRQ
jgi:hypothetical protein